MPPPHLPLHPRCQRTARGRHPSACQPGTRWRGLAGYRLTCRWCSVQHEDFRAFFVMLLVQMQNVIAAISSSSTQVRKQFACFARIVLHFLSRLWCSSDALCSATRRLRKHLAPVWTYDFNKRIFHDAQRVVKGERKCYPSSNCAALLTARNYASLVPTSCAAARACCVASSTPTKSMKFACKTARRTRRMPLHTTIRLQQ
jgi:hypothetical protein